MIEVAVSFLKRLNVAVEMNRISSGESIPVPVTNSDGTFNANAVAPGLTLPDVTFTYPDGSTVTYPGMKAYAILFIALALTNSDNDNLGSITEFPTNGEIVLDDITITEVNGQTVIHAGGKNYACTFPDLYLTNSEQEQLETISAYPTAGRIVLDDISVTEVDGDIVQVPGGKNFVCSFPMLEVINSGGDTMVQVSSYPTDGNIPLPDQAISIKNTSNDEIDTASYGNDGNIEIDDTTITDEDENSFQVQSSRNISIVGAEVLSALTSAGVTIINVQGGATPSGYCYHTPTPSFDLGYVTGDSHTNYLAGKFRRSNPAVPAVFPRIKHNATQADVRITPATGTLSTDSIGPTILDEDNEFGNRFAYTDTAGNPSSAAVGSDKYAHVNWKDHDWNGAIPYVVINHVTGMAMTVKYADDGGKVNMNIGGNSHTEWMTYGTQEHHTLTGWMPLDLSDASGPHGARVQPNVEWADNFFEFDPSVSGDARGGFITGESYDASDFYLLYDSGNPDICLELTKAVNSGFQSRLSNFFMKMIWYNKFVP